MQHITMLLELEDGGHRRLFGKQRHALHIALTGTGDNTEPIAALGTLGIKGIG
jgi:hypothetical protein